MGSNLTLHKYTNRFYEIHQTKNEEKPASGVPLCGTKTKNSILRLKSAGEPSQRASQTSFLPTGGEGGIRTHGPVLPGQHVSTVPL